MAKKYDSQVDQKAFLEVRTGLVYIAVPYAEGLVYTSYIDEGYSTQGFTVTKDYFNRLVKKGLWVELSGFKQNSNSIVIE